jgi:hypothetical protein
MSSNCDGRAVARVPQGRVGRRLVRRLSLAVAFVASVLATSVAGAAASHNNNAPAPPDFGPNVVVIDPSMRQSQIQQKLDAIAASQVPQSAQFSTNRYAIVFKPGTYGSAANPLVFQVGFYTQVAGLGLMPQDTVVNGLIESFANECATRTRYGITSEWCNSTTNFWRSLSNLQLNVMQKWDVTPPFTPPFPGPGGPWCGNSEEAWSVSQAAPLRRLLVNGDIVFQDYCSGPNNDASGGFIADSQVSGALNFWGQQQYFTRDSVIGSGNGCGTGGLWNDMYSGVVGAPAPVFSGTCQQNTVVPRTSTSEEQPFLYYENSTGWHVFVPAVRHDTVGTSWGSGTPAGSSLPLSSFFIAKPTDSVWTINEALARGKNLILTPGIYALHHAIVAPHSDTVILGLGFATLVPQNGDAALRVVSNRG